MDTMPPSSTGGCHGSGEHGETVSSLGFLLGLFLDVQKRQLTLAYRVLFNQPTPLDKMTTGTVCGKSLLLLVTLWHAARKHGCTSQASQPMQWGKASGLVQKHLSL